MQQEPDATPLEQISIREVARIIGVNKSNLSAQVESGTVGSHGGKVVLSEVVDDRNANVNLAQSRRRPAKPKVGTAASKREPIASVDASPSRPDATPVGSAGQELPGAPARGRLREGPQLTQQDAGRPPAVRELLPDKRNRPRHGRRCGSAGTEEGR